MSKYGQFCPVAKSLEILGDRWTLLIVRDMLSGTNHFTDLERGLPGISRALLAVRLKQLQHAGIIEKQLNRTGRNATAYQLTEAGHALLDVVDALAIWGEAWAFSEPAQEELDPVLLMWWLRKQVDTAHVPAQRVTVQFDFYGASRATFWLIILPSDVNICLTDPGYPLDVIVTADLATVYKVWGRRVRYDDAIADAKIRLEGIPSLTHAFPAWFGWGVFSPVEQEAMAIA